MMRSTYGFQMYETDLPKLPEFPEWVRAERFLYSDEFFSKNKTGVSLFQKFYHIFS